MDSGVFKRSFLVLAVLFAVKLLATRLVVFGGVGVLGFLVAELPFAVIVAALPTGRRAQGMGGILLTDAILTALLVAVVVFHAYFGRVPSLQAVALADQLGTVKASVVDLFRPAWLLFFADIPLLAIVAAAAPSVLDGPVRPAVRRGLVWAAVCAFAGGVVVGLAWPVPDLSRAAQQRGIAVAEATDWLSRTFGSGVDVDVSKPAEVQARIDELQGRDGARVVQAKAEQVLRGKLKGRNLILIVVESMQGFVVGRTVAGQAVTPNIDALARDGLYFPNTFTQVNAGNTSDAEFVLNTSLYPCDSRAVSADYGDRRFPALPRMLHDAGYVTMTFHPNDVTFWHRDRLYPALGFDEVYASKFFGRDDVVGIGPSDEVLFSKALPVLKKKAASAQPFYAAFVTLTSHHPFELPDAKKRLTVPPELAGTLPGDYLVAMNYEDFAIGQFIQGLKDAGLYDDSVIVVVGDHFGLQPSEMTAQEIEATSKAVGRSYDSADAFNVPLLIAAPGATKAEVIARTAGHVDLVPTLASLMGLPIDGQVHFGRDLLQESDTLLGFRYYLATGSYADGKAFYVAPGATQAKVFDAASRESLDAAPADVRDKVQRVSELERISDAWIKSLPRR